MAVLVGGGGGSWLHGEESGKGSSKSMIQKKRTLEKKEKTRKNKNKNSSIQIVDYSDRPSGDVLT